MLAELNPKWPAEASRWGHGRHSEGPPGEIEEAREFRQLDSRAGP
jgi:hypothetical protein